jgi:hypothetical protein
MRKPLSRAIMDLDMPDYDHAIGQASAEFMQVAYSVQRRVGVGEARVHCWMTCCCSGLTVASCARLAAALLIWG